MSPSIPTICLSGMQLPMFVKLAASSYESRYGL